MEKFVDLPKMQRDAQIRAASFSESDNSVEVVFAAGAIVRRRSWFEGPYDEALTMTPEAAQLERLNSGAPFLNSHDSNSLESVIGVVVPGSARIEKGLGVARVKLSTAEGDRDNVQKIRDGIVGSISVGYLTESVDKIERDGEVPLWQVTRWTPLELSAVPIPADPGAHVRAETTHLYRCAMRDATPSAEVLRKRMTMMRRRAF